VHPVIYLNQNMIEAGKARIAPVSSALLYGRGVFTTLAIYGGRPFLWLEHWPRLLGHADRAGVDRRAIQEATVATRLGKLIAVNRVQNGRAVIALLAGRGRDVWTKGGPRKTDVLIMTGELHKAPANGLALTISPHRVNTRSPLAGVKATNRLEQVLSWEEAQQRDFSEALMLNERGEIVSATMANIFWVKEGQLHTPSLTTGATAGTTRGCVIRLARELSIPVVEGIYELPDLAGADEVFLTSAGLGVAMVTSFDVHHYTVASGSVGARLQEAFRQLTLA
jgi:4-amino-4-deoxychorismate lyase